MRNFILDEVFNGDQQRLNKWIQEKCLASLDSDPPSNIELALKEFTNNHVVVEPTEGHDISVSSCRWGMVAQYIAQGSVDDLDISCMQAQKPSFVTGDD